LTTALAAMTVAAMPPTVTSSRISMPSIER
jgi:hypothetical protein